MGSAYRVAQDVAELVRESLSVEPLTESEWRQGFALRIGGCVRATGSSLDEKPVGFTWSILALSRLDVVGEPRLAASSLMAARLLGARDCGPHRCAQGTCVISGECWKYTEYEMTVPRQLLTFTLRLGAARYTVTRDQRNAFVDKHFLLIRNAYADGEVYGRWLDRHREELKKVISAPHVGPLISLVVPLYKTPPAYLTALLDSVMAQTYGRWELVAVNASPDDQGIAQVLARYADDRIRVVPLAENGGITANTNAGLQHVQGDYVAFLDHDDFLESQALAAIAQAVNADPTTDLLYCDEDTFDGNAYRIPLFKPPYNESFLGSNNYIIHLLTVRREALEATERSGSEVDGAQDYDLTFKVLEREGRSVRLPWVLYHWRMHTGSTNANAQAKPWAQEGGRRAIANHLERRGLQATVTREKTDSTYRIDFKSNLSSQAVTRLVLESDSGADVRKALEEACASDAEIAMLVRSDVVVAETDVQLMLGCFSRPEVFSVVPRVIRLDGLVESAGCLLGPDGSIIKLGKGLLAEDEGFLGRAVRPYDHVVVGDDVCLLRLSMAKEWLGTLSAYTSARYTLNALCARAYECGKVNVYWPFATAKLTGARPLMAHWEQAEEADRSMFARELGGLIACGDPTHDPNFEPESPYYRLRPYEDL